MGIVLYTYDWLPEFPRGFVRDFRIRWAFEEIGHPYDVATVTQNPKTAAGDAVRAMENATPTK